MKNENYNKIKNKKNQRGEILTATALALCAIAGFFLSSKINFLNDNLLDINFSGDSKVNNNEELEVINLPTFSSKQEIINLVKQNSDKVYLYEMTEGEVIFDTLTSTNAAQNAPADNFGSESANKATTGQREDYSTTNTQVKNVDEADIVKTNGEFIYYISGSNLYIFSVKSTQTKLVYTIEFSKENGVYPQELYIDDNYITVISYEYINNGKYDTRVTAMQIYDIKTYELLKEVKTEGSYVSSRKIDSNIYLVTNKYLYSYRINEDNVLPLYRDDISGDNYNEIPASEIKYFSDTTKDCNYMIITSVNLDNLDAKASIDTYLGAGTEIYCSNENLYVAKVQYENNYTNSRLMVDIAYTGEQKVTTKIHKFKLLDGEVKYIATGEVTGTLLNQYSMDENNDYFRITTTSSDGNSLYVLNSKLEMIGELKNLAKGEKIYATRFIGDKCYVVTYKTVDPLFVIDLSNPTNPKLLGELKIPGYSTYLHPLGENYLIGFGEDSVEKSYKNWEGNDEVIAYNTGLKLAIFDITDLNNPKELDSVKIGGRGSSSELLNNPRALYFNEEEGIFAFPAKVAGETKFYEDGTPIYGDTIFQGALVYNLSIENGISLRGKITHNSTEKIRPLKSVYNIERIISIKDNFYTLSPNMIKVTNIDTMEEIKEARYEGMSSFLITK